MSGEAHTDMPIQTGICTDDRLDVDRPAPARLKLPAADLRLANGDAVNMAMGEPTHGLWLTEAFALRPTHESKANRR